MLKDRIDQVEERIGRAVLRAGRKRSEITLLAVTKKFPGSVIREAYELGLREFGENYVQEFDEKSGGLGPLPGARFHLIGHLQSNKAARAAELFQTIQTVDSARLARRLEQAGRRLDVLIEVKLSPEESKSGAAPEEIPALADAVRALPNLSLLGLMTMPPWSDNPEETRPYFRRLKQVAVQCRLAQLSMGMSHDLEAAIEEGATIIRVGTALFGPRVKA